jgi:restriction system protein
MSWFGYYFLPDAISSINEIENEEERHQVENEVRETEAQLEVARGAAQSGDLELILALTPTEFEYAMAAILRMLGMTNIQRVGGRGHLSVDIIAQNASRQTVLVQCKRRARTKKIGSPEIEKFIGLSHMHHQVDLRLFVTTSEFTDHARARAQLHGVQLLSGSDIENLARR